VPSTIFCAEALRVDLTVSNVRTVNPNFKVILSESESTKFRNESKVIVVRIGATMMKINYAGLASFALLLTFSQSVRSQRINIGSSTTFVDENDGQLWQADPFTTSGSAKNACSVYNAFHPGFVNTDLFCHYREWTGGTSGVLTVPVSSSGYNDIYLYFAIAGDKAGARMMDVYVENSKVLANLDVAARIGGSNGVFTFHITKLISDGTASIEVKSIVGNPSLAAILVVPKGQPVKPVALEPVAPVMSPVLAPVKAPVRAPVTAPVKAPVRAPVTAPVKAPVRAPVTAPVKAPVMAPVAAPVSHPLTSSILYNVGATVPFTDAAGSIWKPDPFTGGTAQNICTVFKQFKFNNADLYCQYREWTGTTGVLNIPIPSAGTYHVALYFVNPGDFAGARVMDLYLEGQKIFPNLDVAARVGATYGTLGYRYTLAITDGSVSIEIKSIVGKPLLAAVEVSANTVQLLGSTTESTTFSSKLVVDSGNTGDLASAAPPTFQVLSVGLFFWLARNLF
jgi:Malectin domain